MIEINLIPLELRKNKRLLSGGVNIPIEIIIGTGGGLIMLLILFHIGLLVTNIAKFGQHKMLENEWSDIIPAKQNLDVVVNELRYLQDKQKSLQVITKKSDILWSEKLNIISDHLPRGVWFNKMALTEYAFFIDGSAISRKNREVMNAHQLVSNLKEESKFLNGLLEIELGSIQRRKIKKVEIADFVITSQLDEL